jgi:hypothetical protein
LRVPGALCDSLGGDPPGRFRAESTPGELEVVVRLVQSSQAAPHKLRRMAFLTV